MRAMSSDSKISVGLGAALAGAATVAVAAVPQPPINGVVVEDVTQSYVFDRIGFDVEIGMGLPRWARPRWTVLNV
jgi:hypothetical protein